MQRSILLALVLSAAVVPAVFGWPARFPTGTTLYDPEKAYDGYTLFAPMGEDNYKLYLINMGGQVVHEWKLPFKVIYGRLLRNGNLVVIAHDPKIEEGRPGILPFRMGGVAGMLFELTWEGTVVFRHEDLNMHHDAVKLANGNYLYLAWERVPKQLQAKVRGGIKHTEFPNLLRSQPNLTMEEFEHLDRVMFNDVLIEVDPQHEIVWQWHANEHLDPDVDIIGMVYPREEWCHANTINVLKNGNVLITSRTLDAMMVIDKQTGEVTFRWGNSQRLDKETGEIELVRMPTFPALPGPATILSGPHGAEEVPAGLPGEGHFTCYDNGCFSPGPLRDSRGIEIDPQTGKIVWQSTRLENGMSALLGRKHFSEILGSAQRLPNGNMLLCAGINGRLFQVAQDQTEVWEYVSPFSDDVRFNGAVIKAYCYPTDYCPQFARLLPVKGPAVLASAEGGESHAGLWQLLRSADSMWLAAGLVAAAACLLAVGFAFGRKRGRLQATAAVARPAIQRTKRRRR
jgi:hypothetical protein